MVFKSPCQSLEELDRVYVYLLKDDKPICYWRSQVSNFSSFDPEMIWCPLTNDLAVGDVKKAHTAGMIQMKLTVIDLQKEVEKNLEIFPAWKQPVPKRNKSFMLRCFVF